MFRFVEIRELNTQNKVKQSECSAKNWILMNDTEITTNVFVQETVKVDFCTIPLGV